MSASAAVTYRPTLRQLLPQIVLVVAAFAASAALGDLALLIISFAFLGMVLFVWRRFATVVQREGLLVMGVTNRTIPWNAITRLQEHEQFGGRGLVVVERSGRKTLLKAPRDSLLSRDRHYEEKRDHIMWSWEAS